jgi:hypothetical protein
MVAHPGHELMVYNWIERYRPVYCCLTDGSGGSATSRLDSTRRLLTHLGAPTGQIYGRYPDKEVYRLLLDGEIHAFVNLAEELAEALTTADVDLVAGDAVGGFNPAHDLCRIVIDGAVAIAYRDTGRLIDNYEFALDAPPLSAAVPFPTDALVFHLEEPELDRKLAAALGYPEMRSEVQAALERFGRRAFAVECLRPAVSSSMRTRFEDGIPQYERNGKTRVDQGLYREVLRYREHVLPVLTAIEDAAR